MANYTLKQHIPALQPSGLIGADIGGRGTTSSPAYVELQNTSGSKRYLFFDTNNRLRTHSAVPTANTDGSVIDQSFTDSLTDTSTAARYTKGTLRTDSNGYIYRYVKNIDVTASTGWALAIGSASDPYIVSGDRSGGSAINSVPAGIALGTLGIDKYGWIMVSGYKANVLSDGGVAAGEAVVSHGSTDGGVDSAAVASTVVITNHQTYGLAMANDTTSRVKLKVSTL